MKLECPKPRRFVPHTNARQRRRRKRKKTTKRKIKTAIFVDPFGTFIGGTAEAEVKKLKKDFEELLDAKLAVHTPQNPLQIEVGTELLLFDWGGMSYGNSLMEDNSRSVIRWAQDNPSALVVIVSTFTYDNAARYIIKEEMSLDEEPPRVWAKDKGEQHKTPIHNIVVCCWDEDFIPEWFSPTKKDSI